MRAEAGRSPAALPPALRFIVAAATSPEAAADLRMAPEDWPLLTAVGHRHGLAAVVPPALDARSDVPSAVREQAHDFARARAAVALHGMSGVVRLSRALRQAGIPCVALKGPAFSEWLYGSIAFRRFSDLDLLVLPEHRDAAYEVIRAQGYALPDGMSVRTARVIYGDLGAWPLTTREALPVDLHWRLAQRRFPSPLRAQQVVAAAHPLSGGRPEVHVPSATHTAVLTLLHASKHLWCTLEMVLSIARLMRRPDIDWPLAESLLRRSHGWRGSVTGLLLASELFETPLPAIAIDRRSVDASTELRDAALTALLKPAGEFSDRWQERRAHRAALDGLSDRLRYDAWRLAAPTPLEWAWCPLPDGLAALYAPLRLVRLGHAAARRLFPASRRRLQD